MDWSARDLGVDPVELRRKNFIPREAFPYRIGGGRALRRGRLRAGARPGARRGRRGRLRRRARRRARREGRLRGLGLAYYIESILGDQNETTTIAFADDGMVELLVGTQSNGQGHETAFAQILAERSGVPFERIRFVQGDSDRIAKGGGTGGSRSTTMQGNSINHAADQVIARFRPLAEEELEVAGADLVFEDGAYRVAGTDREVGLMDLAEVARRAGQDRAPEHHARVRGAGPVLSERGAFRRGGGRPGDRADAGGEVHRGRRLRLPHQPDAGRGAGARRRGAGDRAGGDRGGRLLARRGSSFSGSFMDYAHAAGGRRAVHGVRRPSSCPRRPIRSG